MLIRGSSEKNAEAPLQRIDNKMTRSNFELRRPGLPVRMVLITHPIPARATPIELAATECGAKIT